LDEGFGGVKPVVAAARQHFLYFFPLPQGQRSFLEMLIHEPRAYEFRTPVSMPTISLAFGQEEKAHGG